MTLIGDLITMQFTNNNNSYYNAMDQISQDHVIEPLLSEDEAAVGDALNLGTAELGTTTNPMGNTLQSVKSRIMEGAGRLEFEFVGKGKGNSQSPTPESYGVRERQDMKELVTINDIKSSVHASVHTESLAGFGQGGFDGNRREEAMREIRRAVDFAGDVTDGGAIVFHMSEWQRPMTYAGKRTLENEKSWMFKGYDTEEKDSQLLVVDKRTGKFIEGIQKDKDVYEPVYRTVASDDQLKGMVGELVDIKDPQGNPIKHRVEPDDWVTVGGKVIPKYTKDPSLLFERVPEWNKEGTNFNVRPVTWNNFVERAKKWNEANPDDQLTPEELYARTELENRVLQFKGNSLYHARMYDDLQEEHQKIREALALYEKYEGSVPAEELEALRQSVSPYSRVANFLTSDRLLPSEQLRKALDDVENNMRHIHESSAAADAQAKQHEDMLANMQTAEKYGLERSAEAIAKVGLMAREETARKKLKNPLYAAPENYDQHLFGSHPEEMRRIITESRQKMAEQLAREHKVGSVQEGLKEASKHIKATLDIGHMNMWRQYFNPLDKDGNEKYKTAAEREKAFEKWLIKETEQLVKDGVVGHVHLTDNYGYGDEHLTPGQGNVPMKEFLKRMEQLGMKDMIIEPGSFNISTAFPDTLAMVGSPIYGIGRLPRFNRVQHAHFGYNAPSFFIAGSYVPSNDWRPWTEVPLE